MRVFLTIAAVLCAVWLAVAYWMGTSKSAKRQVLQEPGRTAADQLVSHEPAASAKPMPSDTLLAGYGDTSTLPIEDLRKLQRVMLGYFSVVKDRSRYPIGGNADLAAVLLGENVSRRAYLRAEHPAIGEDGLLVDRWGTPLFVHPEAARELALRSAGPDRMMFNDDDVMLLPDGSTGAP